MGNIFWCDSVSYVWTEWRSSNDSGRSTEHAPVNGMVDQHFPRLPHLLLAKPSAVPRLSQAAGMLISFVAFFASCLVRACVRSARSYGAFLSISLTQSSSYTLRALELRQSHKTVR